MRITCPDCHGSGVEKTGDETVPCTGCSGRGWVDDEPTSNAGIQKPRRTEAWLLAVGALILLGLLGHVLNQQRASRQTSDIDESPPRESAPVPAPEPPSDATRRNDAGNLKPSAAPVRVVYMVTHKHRLRDCHGTLTFTRKGLRFDSDEPQDSFDVALDDVTIEGDALRIRNKEWRFAFNDDVRAERLFNDWKAGTLTPVSVP